jgi:O-antigen/teichoic acid export membrane protein
LNQDRSHDSRFPKFAAILRVDKANRARLGSIAHLLVGNFTGSLLGLAAFALSARALGPTDYGQLALMYAFTRVVERIVSFQSWQPIIRYGAPLMGADNRDSLRSLLKFGLALDAGAAIAAFSVAIVGAHLVAPLFGWSESTVTLLSLYSVVLLFQISGTPTAVQRMAGNFRLLAYGNLVNSVIRVGLCAWGAWHGAGLVYFLAVWGGTQILGSLTFLGLAIHALHRQGVGNFLVADIRGISSRFPAIWSFVWSANLSLTLRMSSHELDTLLVGALADPTSAGLYHIAKRIGSVGQQVGGQVQAVLYPDVTRLWAEGKVAEFKRLVLQVEAVLLAFGIAATIFVALTIQPILRWTAGPQFLAAAPLVIVQMIAVTFVLAGSAGRSALLAIGRQNDVLSVVVVATLAFHLTAFLLIPHIGAMGGNIAHIVLGAIWTTGLIAALSRALKPFSKAATFPPPVTADLMKPEGA